MTADFILLWISQHHACFKNHYRQVRRLNVGGTHQHLRFGIAAGFEPAVRNEVASEEVFNRVRTRRPGMPDDSNAGDFRPVLGLPRRQHFIDRRIQALFGRIPGFFEILIQMDFVDRPDRGLDVRICSEQNALCRRIEISTSGEQVDSLHARHPLIGDEHGDRVAAGSQFENRFKRGFSRRSGENPVIRLIAGLQIAANGRQHLGIVIDDEDDRFAQFITSGRGQSEARRETR